MDLKDLEDVHIEWLIHSARISRDTTPLIKHLRDGRKVTPELAKFIADILEKNVSGTPKKRTILKSIKSSKTQLDMLKETVKYYREIFDPAGHGNQDWNALAYGLRQTDYMGAFPPETKGDITKAAEHLAAMGFGISWAQMDELIRARSSRKKHVK